jgi:DUF4097 and DUF4098 domain-containing protein YvlB
MPEFDAPHPITFSLRLGGGGAEIIAEARTTAVVEVTADEHSENSREAAANTRVELRGDTLIVEPPEWTGWLFRRGPRVRVTARIPLDSTLVVRVASADVRASGRYATASVNSSSGDVFIEHVTGDASVNTASGDARLDRVDGQVRVHAASGDASVGHAGGDVSVHSASGDVDVQDAGGSVLANTASGDITIGTTRHGAVRVHSASGDVAVGVASGTGVWLDLTTVSGSTRSDLAVGPTDTPPATAAALTLQVRTISGDIDVHRVGQPAAA